MKFVDDDDDKMVKVCIRRMRTEFVWWGWIWENRFVCALWFSVHVKSVVEQGLFHEFTFDNKALKTFIEFWICWKRSKLDVELCHMSHNI